MLEVIYPILTIMGLTILGVVFYFSFELKHILKILSILSKIKTNNHLDAKEYIDSIALQLRPIGIEDISYKLSYSNSTVSYENTILKEVSLVETILQDNLVSGNLGIYVKNNKGERKILNTLILHIITLQVINHIHSKIHTNNESFAKLLQLQTYMMHDLKNILQFFQAMQYNVATLHTDEDKSRFIHYLQNNTEPVNKKVNNILTLLKIGSSQNKEDSYEDVSLAAVFREYANFYLLECSIEGDAVIYTNKEHITAIADNILGNIYDKKLLQNDIACKVTIEDQKDKICITVSDNGYEFKNPLEVCEPFYTTKQGGIGIGMYQVAGAVKLLNGTIVCKNVSKHPQIVITINKSLQEEK